MEYKKHLVYYFQLINRKAQTTQIMTPYFLLLTSAIIPLSSCQDNIQSQSGHKKRSIETRQLTGFSSAA
jgi:hypothetical protein